MAHGGGDGVDDGRLDLVPMIDCIMLLLIFFVMTTKFSSEEKAISSLLPTDRGSAGVGRSKELKTVTVAIYPAGPRMVKGYPASQYAAAYQRLATGEGGGAAVVEDVFVRVGQRQPVQIDGRFLAKDGGESMQREVEKIHLYIGAELAKFEIDNEPRNKQNDVVINCFSGLSWKFALVAYDAVRAYEGERTPGFVFTGDPRELEQSRSVNFAPPRSRKTSVEELGEELYELIHLK